MATIREDSVFAAINRVYALTDLSIHNNLEKQFKFKKQIILTDKFLKKDKIVEWIPYNNLQNIRYLTRGGCSEIYTADWINGHYDEWDSKEKRLKRGHEFSSKNVVLKRLENVENASRNWLEEVIVFKRY